MTTRQLATTCLLAALALTACGSAPEPGVVELSCPEKRATADAACERALWTCSSSAATVGELAGCAYAGGNCALGAGAVEAACWAELGHETRARQAECRAGCDFEAYDCESFVIRMTAWDEATQIDAACAEARVACEDACR